MTSTLVRTLKDQPENEEAIRQTPLQVDSIVYGSESKVFPRDTMHQIHKASHPLLQYADFERLMIEIHGLTIVEEAV
ncbi:MAG TPA: hypothetical protein VN372_05310 [Methanospirillum sp.]|nr:hypothetical protein [Methanospirillum sp.]